MKRLLLGTLALLLGLACLSLATLPAAQNKEKKEAPVVPPRKGKSETIKLFNGKNLDGWEGHEEFWSVKDGVIVGKNTDEVKVSTYLVTKKKFSDFRLRHGQAGEVGDALRHRLLGPVGRRSSRRRRRRQVHLRRPSGDVPVRLGHVRPVRPQRSGAVDGGPAKKVGKQHDWNDLEILAQGNRVRVAVNGNAVVDWRDPRARPHQGRHRSDCSCTRIKCRRKSTSRTSPWRRSPRKTSSSR